MTSLGAPSPRYRVLRPLGRGGMGEVLLVFDAEREQEVAQKRILSASSAARLRFKREFRAIEELHHPGLVRLYELGEDAHGLYFTMEVVAGTDILSHCRRDTGTGLPTVTSTADLAASTAVPMVERTLTLTAALPAGRQAAAAAGPVVDAVDAGDVLARLAGALPQIIEALAFLHGRGIVHRDLKAGNIMVRPDGVVKLLDFGILAHIGAREPADPDIAGTLGYMAPEQLRGDPATPASDLYALGVLLYRLAAGRPPFAGPHAVLEQYQSRVDPPSLADVAPGALPALVDACAALLRRDPDQRPSLDELALRLLPELGARMSIRSAASPALPALVGRDDVVADLRDRLAGGSNRRGTLVALTGPTGAGKSALADGAAREAEREGVAVLRGRGRPSERVAFNAVDGAIDMLAGALARLPDGRSPAATRAMAVAALAFPVLAPPTNDAARPTGAPRSAVFAGVLALIDAVAQPARGALLVIDDLQWADEDSLALLDFLADAAPAGLAILATLRSDIDATPGRRWLAARGAVTIEVGPLAPGATAAIVERAARAAGAAPSPAAIARAAASCAGVPFLAEVAGRALAGGGAADLPDVLRSVVAALADEPSPVARDTLALLVAADGWTPVGELVALGHRIHGEVADALGLLERRGLVRRAGPSGPDGTADVYHDAVRAVALHVLHGDPLVAAHAAFADRLARDTTAPPHRLVRHLLGAGRTEQAAEHAPIAAHRAEAQHAHGLAADLYAIALRHPGARRAELLRRRAGALERGARYGEAADGWRELAGLDGGDQAVDATLHEAHALLAANQVALGRRRIDEALVRAGERPLGGAGLRGVLAGLAFLSGPRRRGRHAVDRSGKAGQSGVPTRFARHPPTDQARAERDVRLGTMIGYFDPLTGIRFLRGAYRAFDRMGAARETAWCDYLFGYYALFGARRRGPVRLAGRYLAAASARLTGLAIDGAEILAMPHLLAGVAAQRDGRWDEGARELEAGLAMFERDGIEGTFEHMLSLVHRTQVDLFGHRLAGADAALARLRRAQRDSADSAIGCHLEFLATVLDLLRGRFAEADERAAALAAAWPADRPTFQRLIADVVLTYPAIYLTDGREARRRLAAALRRDRAFRPLHNMYAGFFASVAALAEASALRSGDGEASGRRIRRLAAIARAAPPLAATGALRALAYAADARGRPEAALRALAAAEQAAADAGQVIDVAIARYQRGRRLGGAGGDELMAAARRQVAAADASEGLLDEDVGLR